MNNEVKPLHALGIIIFFIVLISAYTWINSKAVGITGPDGLYKNQKNHLFVRVQNDLLEFNASGKFIKNIDLKSMGVEFISGDILFMPNNEIILRLGKDTRTLTQNIRTFFRLDDETTTIPATEEAGLFRCNLNTYSCYRFTKSPMDFNSAYHLEYDNVDGGLFVSDTSRHRILKFSDQGTQLFEYNSNLRFPNQIKLYNNQLYIANTNHHEITQLNIKHNKATFNKNFNVISPVSEEYAESFPAILQRINDNWWIINMTGSMEYGGIYIYDNNWNFTKRISTKENADPVDILQWHNNEILIADPTNFTLSRYSADGFALKDFSPLELQEKLTALKTHRENFKLLSYLPISIFIISITAGIIIGIRQQLKINAEQKQKTDIRQAEILNSNELKWLSIDENHLRKIRLLAMSAPIFLFLSMVPIMLLLDNTKLFNALIGMMLALFIFVSVITIAALFYLKTLSNIKIGLQGKRITLIDHCGIETSTDVSNVYYDNKTIYFNKTAVIYANNKRVFFYKNDARDYLFPFLKSATRINSFKMFYFLYKIKHPSFYFSLIIFVTAIIMLIFTNTI